MIAIVLLWGHSSGCVFLDTLFMGTKDTYLLLTPGGREVDDQLAVEEGFHYYFTSPGTIFIQLAVNLCSSSKQMHLGCWTLNVLTQVRMPLLLTVAPSFVINWRNGMAAVLSQMQMLDIATQLISTRTPREAKLVLFITSSVILSHICLSI
jgi:hypothetical protein